MKKIRRFRKSVVIGLVSLLTVSNVAFGTNITKAETSEIDKLVKIQKPDKKIEDVSYDYKDSDIVRVIVELEGDPAINYSTKRGIRYKDLETEKKTELQKVVKEEHSEFISDVKEEKIEFEVENTFTTVVNGVSGEIEFSQIEELEKLPNVEAVSIVNEYKRPTEKPTMLSSKDMVEAIQTWNAGYDGKGMVVGIIDTGIDYEHKDMQLQDDNKHKLTKTKVNGLVQAGKLPGQFYNVKVPYGYNYADKNSEILDLGPDASMHGMHVGGTVGANGDENGNGIKGIAPMAQLLALKVFGNDPAMPSTFGDIYIKAIDDGIILGADVLNMSLGSTAGFADSNSLEQKAVERAVENGVLMSISAGNSSQFGANYTENPLATNPDIGLVGAPSLAPSSISVASLENDKLTLDQMSLKIGSETLPIAYKKQSSPLPLEVFGKGVGKDVIYVGDGGQAQYTGKNVKGKVVFAVRSAANPNYGEIQLQAEKAGAAGVIIRGTAAHGDYVSMALNNPTIPFVTLSVADGTNLETKLKAAGGVGKVEFSGKMTTVINGSAGKMSNFSSWGVAPGLEMKPEITAPGGQIYSTLNNDQHGVMSGTSMAAPHVAGGAALVLEKVQELFPSLKGADKVKRAKTILMNTAKIVTDPATSGIAYSPRLQGAGIMQLNAAVTTPVYVEAKDTKEGKIELKEIGKDKFSMTVTATNFSDEKVTYNVDASVLTDATSGSEETASNALKEQVIKDAVVTIDTPQVTLFAGKSKDITVEVDLSKANTALENIQKNGYFVEGFITLTNKSQDIVFPDLSVPYLGFKGDWNKPPVLDQMIFDTGSYYKKSGMLDGEGYYLGYNPFTKKYSKSLIAISPNGDGKNEAVAPVLSFLRNSKTVEYAITDETGKILRKLRTDKEQRKNYHNGKSAGSIYSYKPNYTEWDGKLSNKVAADGTYYYQVKTQVDFGGKEQQVTKIPVIVDNTAPVVSKLSFSKKTGTLSFNATDKGSGLQYIEVYVNGKLSGSVNPGTSSEFKLNVGKIEGEGKIKVVAYDYANNHSGQDISGPGDNTIPFIISDTPEAQGVYDTREVPFSGYVTDASQVDYLKIKGDKLNPTSQDIKLKYNEVTKQYEFATHITFTEDGVHDIYIEGADKVGNKIEFRRQVIIDTQAPTLSVSNLPDNNFVSTSGEGPIKVPESKDPIDATENKDVIDAPESKDVIDATENKDPKKAADDKGPVDTTDSKDPIDTPDSKEPIEVPESKDTKETDENKDPKKATDGKDPIVTVSIADNFDDLRLLVNGSEEFTKSFDQPYEMRSFTKDIQIPLELKDGKNEFVFEVKDLGGHVTKKTIAIYKGDNVKAPYVKSLELSNGGGNVTVENPAHIIAEASESIVWEAKVIDSEGKVTDLEPFEGETYEGTFTPDILAESGSYKLSIGAAGSTDSERIETEFTVSNYPASLESVLTTDSKGEKTSAFTSDSSVSIKASLKNQGNSSLKPTVAFQVKDEEGAVVYFKEVDSTTVNSKAKNRFVVDVPLETFEKGKYTVEVFVWDNDDIPIPLAESSNIGSFTVN
ncbi:S8 family serine peptidase [Viridibacillus sp. YIM B01967]|uniref:S8 family serine peptidase n=1 Tax=Viridibacillus soli TaxID=2798301 RepID=A0ABS1HCG4_9BACL|nr:S8 family serine peptidase [Viridibacillus soli]MBK3497113.1 S8 family serine peptidase [Viridibacillus soli]